MTERRNVVLITVDSLRADHCGFMGYDRETTPTLDRMARDGYTFEAAIAPGPSTYESMPAVFTGRHMTSFCAAARSVAVDSDDPDREDALDARTRNIHLNMRARTIAEWFNRNGYSTAAFTTNPYTSGHTAFARGFDRYEDFMGPGEGPLMRKAAHLPVLSELKHVVTLLRGDRASKRWEEYYEQITEWVHETSEPYFLWIFLLDTHTPYLPARRYRSTADWDRSRTEMYYHNWRLWAEKKWRDGQNPSALNRDALVDLYDAGIRSVDEFLARLQTDLEATDPAIVVHSDHGEAFGEHGTFGHHQQLHEENLHVPLVVANTLTGAEAAPVTLADLPAVLRWVARPERDEPDLRPGPVLAKTFDHNRFAIRGPDWKYLCTVNPETSAIQRERVYDLATDPAERTPQTNGEAPETITAVCRRSIQRRLRHEIELNTVVKGTAGIRGEMA